MNNKLVMVMIVGLLCISLAHAATVFLRPTTGGSFTGLNSGYFNFTINTTTLKNMTNCTISGSSATTGDSLSGLVALNRSAQGGTTTNDLASNVNATLRADLLLDAADWTFSATCMNKTGQTETATTITGVNVDTTTPTCSIASPFVNSATIAPTQKWTWSTVNTTSTTIQFGSNPIINGLRSTGANGLGKDTYTMQDSIPEGRYAVTVRVTDGTNSTTSGCSLTGVEIDEAAELIQIGILLNSGDIKKDEPSDGSLIGNPLMMVFLIGGAVYLMNKKKK